MIGRTQNDGWVVGGPRKPDATWGGMAQRVRLVVRGGGVLRFLLAGVVMRGGPAGKHSRVGAGGPTPKWDV